MKKDILLSGVLGLVAGTMLFLVAGQLSGQMPSLLEEAVLVAAFFIVLFLIALAEIPIMIFTLRQMAHNTATPRPLILGINAGYVAFASIYAAVYLLITREGMGALVLAGLGIVRLLSGVLVR